jgi:hypothetical protein
MDAPSTSTVPQDTCTVDSITCTVDQDARTVDPDTCAVASSARTVAPATSTLASSAASVATSTRVMAPATVTVATGSVTVTTSTVCDAGLAHARFNHGLACGPTSHTESIRQCNEATVNLYHYVQLGCKRSCVTHCSVYMSQYVVLLQ